MDLAARNAQVARIIANVAGDAEAAGNTVLAWRSPANTVHAFPAVITELPREEREFDREAGDDRLVRVTIARETLGAARPRLGQHFTDAAGRILRIVTAPPSDHGPTASYECTVADRV